MRAKECFKCQKFDFIPLPPFLCHFRSVVAISIRAPVPPAETSSIQREELHPDVFGEGAKDDTRGRVWSPAATDASLFLVNRDTANRFALFCRREMRHHFSAFAGGQ